MYNLKLFKMILTCYISTIVMIVTIKDTSLKQPIQGIMKWTKQQRETYKSPKQITSAKKKDLLMLYETGLIPKQHHAFFSSQTVTTSGRKIDDTDSNSHSGKEEDESSDVH